MEDEKPMSDDTIFNEDWTKQTMDVVDPETGMILPRGVSLKRLSEVLGLPQSQVRKMPVWVNSRGWKKRRENRKKLRELLRKRRQQQSIEKKTEEDR
jgi:hypothetical protein